MKHRGWYLGWDLSRDADRARDLREATLQARLQGLLVRSRPTAAREIASRTSNLRAP